MDMPTRHDDSKQDDAGTGRLGFIGNTTKWDFMQHFPFTLDDFIHGKDERPKHSKYAAREDQSGTPTGCEPHAPCPDDDRQRSGQEHQ